MALLDEGATFDAVVTDYAMPGMNGGDLLAAIRAIRPELPGMIVSGFVDLPQTHSLDADIVMLHKPFAHNVMIRTLSGLLGWEPSLDTLFEGLRPRLGEA